MSGLPVSGDQLISRKSVQSNCSRGCYFVHADTYTKMMQVLACMKQRIDFDILNNIIIRTSLRLEFRAGGRKYMS